MSPNQGRIYQTHPFAQKSIHQNSPALQRFFSAGEMGDSNVNWILKKETFVKMDDILDSLDMIWKMVPTLHQDINEIRFTIKKCQ